MATDSLAYVLGLLRKLKSTPNVTLGNSSIGFLREWAGTHDALTIAKLAIAIQQNLAEAHQIITNSHLNDEAKSGLFDTINALRSAFSIENMNTGVSNYLPAIDPALTNFAIITSNVGAIMPDAAVDKISELITEFSQFCEKIDNLEIPLNVKETVKRHLILLIAMLHNAQAVGIDPAVSAYYDMILSLRKEIVPESTEQNEDQKGLWAQIKKWSSRFEAIYDLIDKGGKALPYLSSLPRIAGF